MKASLITMAAATTGAAAQTVPTVHVPLNFYYGPNHKISTNLRVPSSNTTLEVVFDSGSENFFVFGPNSIDNWGSSSPGSRGPCNASVPLGSYFNYTSSPSASKPVSHAASFVYGGADKVYTGKVTVNDTLVFTSAQASQVSTVPNTRVQLMDFLIQRIQDEDCSSSSLYDLGILGISPFYAGAARNTTGPHIRQDLLERGLISAPVQSMWFDEAPAAFNGTFTGSGLFGGIDTSKFSGELVKVANRAEFGGNVGYFVAPPKVSVNGVVFSDNTTSAESHCQLDSGTHDDKIPVPSSQIAAFQAATGIVTSPVGYTAWNGTCDTIPANTTIDLAFPGAVAGEVAIVKIPLKSYARIEFPGETPGYCTLSLKFNGCFLGAPFATASFFAADDKKGEIALAQGGVSKVGSGVDEASVVASIP